MIEYSICLLGLKEHSVTEDKQDTRIKYSVEKYVIYVYIERLMLLLL